jgi:hypothetical protein
MHPHLSSAEPPERIARPDAGRAASLCAESVSATDPRWCETLEGWLDAIRLLEGSAISPLTRAKLRDCHRICAELLDVLAGRQPGEGRACERSLFAVPALGWTQGLSSMFACPRGTFVELMAAAPWNLLGKEDPPDSRTMHGAGSALVAQAVNWSRLRGCGGRVALQAENPRTLRFYQKLGFRPMAPEDEPLALVPRGELGWSPEVQRVARGCPGPDEERAPWLVMDPVPLRDVTPAISSAA